MAIRYVKKGTLFKAFYITPYLLVVFQSGFFLGHTVYFNQHQIEGPLLCIDMEKKACEKLKQYM